MVMTRLCRFKIDEWMCWIWIFMWDNESVIVCWWSSRLEFQVRCLYLAQSINSNLQSILILQRCISILVCTVSILSLSYSIFSVISILLLRFSSSSCEILSIESIFRNSFFTADHSQYQMHTVEDWYDCIAWEYFPDNFLFLPRNLVARVLFVISSSVKIWPWWFVDFHSSFLRLYLMKRKLDIPLQPYRDIWSAMLPICNRWRVLIIILFLFSFPCCTLRHGGILIVSCPCAPLTMKW